MEPKKTYAQTKTSRYFHNTCKYIYYFGALNVWFEELDISSNFKKLHDIFWKFSKLLIFILVLMELGSYATQKNLSKKQTNDQAFYTISHPLLFYFVINTNNKNNKIAGLLFKLMEMKKKYNDLEVEKLMILKAKRYSASVGLLFTMCSVMYGMDALSHVITAGGTFTTMITAWPDVNDHSAMAGLVRILIYLVFCIFNIQIIGVYIIFTSLVICLSFQYKNVQSYFYNLNGTFENDDLNQEEKEAVFEKKLKKGMVMHSETLACIKECQQVSSLVFSGQVTMNTILLGLVLSQMVASIYLVDWIPYLENPIYLTQDPNDRSLARTVSLGVTALSFLVATGVIMWSVGDITIEASFLSTAIYASGWQHCVRRNKTVRTLLMIAMLSSSRPVVFTCLGVIDLSYSSYVTIVKSSYSVFSVLY